MLAARESYLGIQDAARKIRGFNGVRDPGAWAGSDVDDESSNYRELRNLVEAVEVDSESGHLLNTDLTLRKAVLIRKVHHPVYSMSWYYV